MTRRGCDFPKCVRPHNAKGYCTGHGRQLSAGKTLSPLRKRPLGISPTNSDPNGFISWTVNKTGYLVATSRKKENGSRGKISLHRKVAESVLNRPLESWENVHHINGHKTDNRPANLEIWVVPQPQGQRVEDIVTHCEMMLRHYAPEKLAKELINAV